MLTRKEYQKHIKQCKREFGDQVTELRKKRRMSIEDMHIEIGVPITFLEKLELGMLDIRISNLVPIARFLDKKIKIELID